MTIPGVGELCKDFDQMEKLVDLYQLSCFGIQEVVMGYFYGTNDTDTAN